MPTTQMTNSRTTRSHTHTNDSTFRGFFLLLQIRARCLPVRLMKRNVYWFAGGWFGTSLDEASVKPRWKTHWERLLIYGLKLNFHRYIGQLRRLSPPHRKTPWRPLFVYKWRHVRTTTTCTPSATIRTSRRTVVVQRHGRRRTVLLVCNKVTNDDRTVV